MSSEKLMTNGQGISLAQVGRAKKVPSANIQKREKELALVLEAIRDGRSITVGPMPTELQYPDWVKERLTPDLEVTKTTDPGKVELWLDPSLGPDHNPTGYEVYRAHGDRLKRALSLGHLKFFDENPDKIPDKWKEQGLYVYGWASVVRLTYGDCYVPYLECHVDQSFVDWCRLSPWWTAREPSGLLASSTKH